MLIFSSKEQLLKRHLDALRSHKPDVRMRAAQELADLGRIEAVPHLIRALTDADKRVRWRVAYALSDFGERGHEAAYEALVNHLQEEPDWNVRRIIVMTLRHWDEKAIPPLIDALDDESKYVRKYAAMTLGFKKAARAVAHLKRLAARDESKEVRDYAVWAIEEINKRT